MNTDRFEQEELCSGVLDAVGDHLAVVDSNGVIVRVNPAWSQFSEENGGIRSRTGVGSNYFEACERARRRGVEEAGRFLTDLQSVLKTGGGSHEMLYPCHSPRELRWFTARATGIRSAGRSYAAVFHSNHTARTLLQDRLVRLRSELQDARRKSILQSWTSFLAHEIKNPLTAILLRSEMLKRMVLSGNASELKLVESCDTITKVVNSTVELIDSARTSLADDESVPETLKVREFLLDLVTILKGWVETSGNPLELWAVNPSLTFEGHRMWLTLTLVSAIFYLIRSHQDPVFLSAEAKGDRVLIHLTTKASPHDPFADGEYRIAEKLMARQEGMISKETSGALERVTLNVPMRVSEIRLAA